MTNKRKCSQIDEHLANSTKKSKSSELNSANGDCIDRDQCRDDNTELDSLVLETCASQTFWPHRIQLESVSRRFARALQTTDQREPIFVRLMINRPADSRPGYGIHCFNSSMSNTLNIYVYGEDCLKKNLRLLCTRFKQFKLLYIDGVHADQDWTISALTQILLDVFATSDCFPMKVQQLKYRIGDQCKNCDWRLIEPISKLLRKLTVSSRTLGAEDLAHLCNQIELCSKLRTLEYFPECDIPPPQGRLLLRCLQSLKLRRFRMSTHSLPLEWLPTAFQNNNDLQTLHIKSPTSELALTLLTSATLLPIVSRLSCLEFDSNKRIAQPYHSAEIVQLIRGMRLDSCVKVYHKVDCSVFDYSSDTLNNREATAQILRFWLNIAQQSSGRELKLCLIFSWDVKRNLENALAHLKLCESYAGVKIERVDKRMILQYNSAAIILSIIAWHDFESERKALRVW